MPYINPEAREIAFKIVYYGPGMSGKTTNLQMLHSMLDENMRGDLISLATEEERTLFFDYFPIDLGEVAGFRMQLNMYTVPGQTYYEASRRLLLDEADGIVFTIDSNPHRLEENLASFRSLGAALEKAGSSLSRCPLVLQYNKRDLPDAVPLGTFEGATGLTMVPVQEAIATRGVGVTETVRAITRLVVARLEA